MAKKTRGERDCTRNMLATKAMRALHVEHVRDNFSAFVFGYLKAAAWADCPEDLSNFGPGEFNMSKADFCFSNRAVARAKGDCRAFLDAAAKKITPYFEDGTATREEWEIVGADFWLTRQGHGCGFQNRPELYGVSQCQVLRRIAREDFGQVDLVEHRRWLDFI